MVVSFYVVIQEKVVGEIISRFMNREILGLMKNSFPSVHKGLKAYYRKKY